MYWLDGLYFYVLAVFAVFAVLVILDVLSVLTQSFDYLPIPRATETIDYYRTQTDRLFLARPHVEASLLDGLIIQLLIRSLIPKHSM